ncbi:putative integral membrane sensor signal transduction histidine kinase [Megalodesulfovibrio gigas DSM 1382 = ATCC 19364]|uniref:histidine kinase n=1 Tax=Megalodesulfovibrio gigas (strain ATCC 19364 / DSM 1382 / NCIMB 9332 / VKM B-1759) TaxID=1121448 RepID=T2G9B7_MEGG1|nr:putative integral membrane sensor signal transduction histidine kinase [Megalodesulfovibrio gigas DSM 1382 = ATCC 19364]
MPSSSYSTAKYLSWGSLALTFLAGLALSIVIANQARQTLLAKQQEFGLLLAQNLNHQIYRRFILPTLVGFGRVELRDATQYERLESVINSTIHGLNMLELRIYDLDGVISYSTEAEHVGRQDLMTQDVRRVADRGEPIFAVGKREDVPIWSEWIMPPKPGQVVMKMTYPLRVATDLGDDVHNGTLVGVLEIYQDIAGVYKTVIRFQWIIILNSLGISLLLFLVLLMLIRRVDKISAQRLQETQRLERQLHQNEKLASMGRMVASIAHEIRNPLGIIRSSAELLLKKQGDENSLHGRILKAIFDESRRLSQIVSDFLDYARPKAPRQEPVELATVLDQVLVFLEHECRKCEVQVERQVERGLMLSGDKDLLYRAFYNIVSNGLQAMAGPGTLFVQASRRGETLETVIRDTGPGIDAAIADKLLDPFFTTKDHGTGLGLAITNGIIQSHGGELRLENAPEGGARAVVLLPAA